VFNILYDILTHNYSLHNQEDNIKVDLKKKMLTGSNCLKMAAA
jgi:hypothetical protein